LLAAHVPEDRVIAQQPNVKLSATLDAFRAAHAKGLRPVMLGLGGAWTGIDLTDPSVPPERDNLLTDLVIVRMPVGLNRTNSALARIERSGTASISNEALLTFKQGLGRLIRRTGVTDRRIWILDGRIFGSWNRMPQLTGAARRLLREYVHQHTF
jgi:CRISPR type IV-associated DEAD/DEAH-box helicase Csf4